MFLLRLNYFYGRFIGVINFEIDMETGKAWISRKATIYAAIVNTLIFGMVPLLINSQIWKVLLVQANRLHEHVFLVMMCMRISCVFVTLLSRWWQRQRIVDLVCSYHRLSVRQPQLMRLTRNGFILKVISGTLTEGIHVALGLYGLHDSLTPRMALSVFPLYVLMGLLNFILAQFYFALLNIHGHYLLINQDLRSILAETHLLEMDHCQRLRQLKSLALATRLNSLARFQSQLQSLVERMTKIFGLQTLCMCKIFTITMISGVYYIFSAFKYGNLNINWSSWYNLLVLCGVISYIVDSYVTHSITSYLQDRHAETVELVAQYSTFAQSLDERLVIAFESFQIQLTRNPLKLSVMGLFNLDRRNAITMLGSMISYSLILIQYDIKYYKTN
ncbi:putative gustatory receptor 59d [Drosophila virilis]|uniref:putative gustatory receptor 59d n=1 Tax=Drosophila virilis TaxID=7244 RepID=UPI00017D3A8D